MEQLVEMTISDMLEYQAKHNPDTEALVVPLLNVRYTYRQLDEICDRVARGFMGMGIEKGDHIAMWSTNYPEWVITQFACAKIGAVIVTVNTNYKKYELEYLLRQSDSKALILMRGMKDIDYTEHLLSLCPELPDCEPGKLVSKRLPCLKTVIFIDDNTPDGMFSWSDIFSFAEKVTEKDYLERKSSVSVHDVANMQYTSGTTGFPKGVMLTHYNLVNNGMAIGDCMKFTNRDRLLIAVPLFHCFGAVLGVMASFTHGTTMVLLDHFHPLRELDILQDEKCTAVHGVPTMFISMLDHPDFPKYDLSCLRTGIMAGSPCPIEYMKRAIEEMHMSEIVITYGQTEASPAITMSRTDDPIEKRVYTVGKVIPHVEAKIINPETGADLGPNSPGEIVARGYNIMKGYYNMPEATSQAIDSDGWLHTGDIGEIDDDGYFRITGRLKDMIIRGGENIYPREIEEYLYTNEKVQDVQVIGVPDRRYGEEVLACIILNKGMEATESEMIDFVKNGLSKFKAPRYVKFVESFPMNAAGKILKYKMREWAVEELGLSSGSDFETT